MAIGSVEIIDKIQSESGVLKLSARCRGEDYVRGKHGSKTEIKAVTFSNMRIVVDDEKCELYVIFDI